MTTQINKVEESKTYSIYNKLMQLGFNVTLSSMFQYSYNKDNRYLSIAVCECEDRLTQLWDETDGLEMILARNATSSDCHIEVRQHRDYADFVKENIWAEYWNVIML